MNLICCPHAGGGKIFYSKWMRSFNKEIEFHVMSYPKRDELVRMRMPSSIQKLAELIFLRNRELFEDDYAIWGHSMGSIVGYELAQICIERLGNVPMIFFASGAKAPCDYSDMCIQYNMPEDSLREVLKEYGGVPKEALYSKELTDYLFPIIREDFRLINQYQESEIRRLKAPIILMNGNEDLIETENWSLYAEDGVEEWEYNGGHFFITDERKNLVQRMESVIMEQMRKEQEQYAFDTMGEERMLSREWK